MLISRVSEDSAGEGREVPREDDSHEYQTASELFEIIAKNHTFNECDDPLTNSDLVILYKNIDLGTRLMSNTTEPKSSPRVNQRVEDVVHGGADADSDSEAGDAHDLAPADVFLINKERLDLLNNPPSLGNTLCHKFGDLEIKMSNLGTDILFKTATVKEQLDNLKLMSSSNSINDSVLPSSLLDYICCKRLEENYTFYMENIIRYVKHTIDQLKRISNGDYLTDKVKEKWREIAEDSANADANNKIIAASTSIPLHVERKRTGRATTWDDIVHSEMDIRYLSKILEKKIFLQVPKIICGSFRMFSQQCADNLVVSCAKQPRKKVHRKDSRVDVVLKLKRSESGQVISNINSIMILKATPSLCQGPILALPVSEKEDTKLPEPKIVELNNETDKINEPNEINEETKNDEEISIREYVETLSQASRNPVAYSSDYQETDSGVSLRDSCKHRTGNYNHYQEAAFVTLPDELSLSMQRLDIQSAFPEESIEEDFPEYQVIKRSTTRSPTRVRIKSPYENRSHLIDEKKRKKLLEIRERREKKKMALSESCKIMKHRHGKGALTPQASSSVTKLSITNKSFYNSIYGQSAAIDNKQKSKVRKSRRDIGAYMSEYHGETDRTLKSSAEKNKPYINKNYLDDAETEMMLYMQSRGDNPALSPSTCSALDSAELAMNLTLLSQQLVPSVVDFAEKEVPAPGLKFVAVGVSESAEKSSSPSPFEENVVEHLVEKKSDHDVVPYNSPIQNTVEEEHDKEDVVSTLECRKSIEKLYGLLKKIRKPESTDRSSKVSALQSYGADVTTFRESSTVQGSDSGTSLKHQMTSSETSNFSFNKPNITNASTMYETIPPKTLRTTGVAANVISKVIISSKGQTSKAEPERHKREYKKVAFSAPKVIPENPLKAISQLLHEFDNVHKTRHKSSEERPVKPKKEAAGERSLRHGPKARSRLDQHLRGAELPTKNNMVITVPRDRRPHAVTDARPMLIHEYRDRYDKFTKRKMSEIIDEVKEARGEAVRGPSKSSRLNTLAQPKRTYVQAHSEEYQTKYGRNLMADRLQRLAAAPGPGPPAPGPPGPRARPRRPEPAPAAPAPARHPAPPPIVAECGGRLRRSASSSPASKRSRGSKHSLAADLPGALKEKMVAVESYVKSHYGRAGSPSPSEQRASKSRVPLLPCDLEFGSPTSSPPNEESTAIGSELHNLIDSMMKNAPVLSALTEALDEKSKSSEPTYVEDSVSKAGNRLMHFDSDLSDIFKDNIQTAVEEYKDKNDSIIAESSEMKHMDQLSSFTELERLEKALYSQMSVGSFQKRLRIKNLTITPKRSMQLVVGVQSGDVGSVMVKTSLSQDFKLTNCSFTKNISELQKTIPILADPSLEWRRSSLPMQVSTVGYAFPKYGFSPDSKMKDVLTSLIHTNEDGRRTKPNENKTTTSNTKDYTCQTFKGQSSNLALGCYSHSITTNEITTKEMCCGDDAPQAFGHEAPCSEVQVDMREKQDLKLQKTCRNILSTENKSSKNANVKKANQEDIEYTTSFDMLVGLLNEIQKITQTQVLNLTNDNMDSRNLENILNNAATLENNTTDANGIVTITALSASRMLESSPSSYSFFITKSEERELKERQMENNEPKDDDVLRKEKPIYVDKEVNAVIPDKKYNNVCTDVPSGFYPITVNTSTSVSNSLIGALSTTSTQSLFSCRESICSDAAQPQKKVLELTTDSDNKFESFEVTPEIIQEVITKIDEVPKLTIATTLAPVIEEVEPIDVVKESKQVAKTSWSKSKDEFDPLLRMKRDILVTVYSVLVLTVFAALSFPDVLYRA